MTIVENDVELFTIHQTSLDKYYKVFKAQVDTIDAHRGNVGYHPVVFPIHLAALLERRRTSPWRLTTRWRRRSLSRARP